MKYVRLGMEVAFHDGRHLGRIVAIIKQGPYRGEVWVKKPNGTKTRVHKTWLEVYSDTETG